MNYPARKTFAKFLVLGLAFFSSNLYAQNSVGIGTNSPNTNAVLELVSTGNNQGLLIPRMTTAQRTDAGFTSGLTASENGLMVFDSDEGAIYHWFNGVWVNSTTLLAGTGISITDNTIDNTGDTDATDDITTASVAAGDVTGDFANLVVEGIQGQPVSTDVPTLDYVLKWDGSQWVPSPDAGNVYTAGTGIDVTGTIITNIGDQDSTNDITTTSISAGDISGTFDAITVNALQGNPVDGAAPSVGQILKWDGSQWLLSNDDDGQDALSVPFDDATAALGATDVQGAIEALDVTVDGLSAGTPDLAAVLAQGNDGGATNMVNVGTIDGRNIATDGTHLDNIQTLSGRPVGSLDIGIVSNPVITDNQTLLNAILESGTAADNLFTTTGVAVGATDLGTFPGTLLSDFNNTKGALTELETAIEAGGFSNTDEIPRGDGVGLVSSNLFSDGISIGLGQPAPLSNIHIETDNHIISELGDLIITDNIHLVGGTPTYTEDGRAVAMALSNTGGTIEFFEATFGLSGNTAPLNSLMTIQGGISAVTGDWQAQNIYVSGSGAVANHLIFGDADNSDTISFRAPNVLGASTTYTLPPTDGPSGSFLSTDGAGILNWTAAPTFNNINQIPRGDGAGMDSSNIFSDGVDILIGSTDFALPVKFGVINESSALNIGFLSYSSITADDNADLSFVRARGTEALPATVALNDRLGTITFNTYNGSFSEAAKIVVDATEAHSGAPVGSSMSLRTAANGETSPSDRIEIDGNGDVIIHNGNFGVGIAPLHALDVLGDVNFSGSLLTGGNQILDINSGTFSTYLGDQAGNTGNFNTMIGYQAGPVTTGNSNAFFGYQSGQNNTTGIQNTFYGAQSGNINTTGIDNTAVGYNAMRDNNAGNSVVALGAEAGLLNDADNNTFVGARAGRNNNTGIANTMLGTEAGFSNGGAARNTMIGYRAGYSVSGDSSTHVGAQAGENIISGTRNTIVGSLAGSNVSTISEIVAVGMGATADGQSSVVVGASAIANNNNGVALGSASSVSGDNGIALGHGATVNANNAIAIGDNVNANNPNTIVLAGTTDKLVGINTNGPVDQLTVATSGAVSSMRLWSSSTGYTAGDGLQLEVNASSAALLSRENVQLDIGTNGTPSITVDPTGNVGIGTVTPRGGIDVVGSQYVSVRTLTGVQSGTAIDPIDYLIYLDESASGNITLPSAIATEVGRKIKVITSSSSSVNVDAQGGDNIVYAGATSTTVSLINQLSGDRYSATFVQLAVNLWAVVATGERE